MASIQEIIKKYLGKSGYNNVDDYLTNRLNPNEVVSDAARKTFEPKSFRPEEPVDNQLPELPTKWLEPVTQPELQQLPQVQSQAVTPTAQELMSKYPELFSSDRIWEAARQSRNSDLRGEGFAAGYDPTYTGSGYQGDPNDAIGSTEQRARITDWYVTYLQSHPEIIAKLEQEKASLASETPYTGMLRENLQRYATKGSGSYDLEKALSTARELEAVLAGQKQQAQEDAQKVKLEEIKSGIVKLDDGTIVNTKEGIVVKPDGTVEKPGGAVSNLTTGALTEFQKNLVEGEATIKAIDNGLALIEADPDAYSFILGILPPTIANRLDSQGVRTRTSIDRITAEYRKWLTGAQMSDKEREAYERFLPAPADNDKIVKNKLAQMRQSIEDRNNILRKQLGQTTTEKIQDLTGMSEAVQDFWSF